MTGEEWWEGAPETQALPAQVMAAETKDRQAMKSKGKLLEGRAVY